MEDITANGRPLGPKDRSKVDWSRVGAECALAVVVHVLQDGMYMQAARTERTHAHARTRTHIQSEQVSGERR